MHIIRRDRRSVRYGRSWRFLLLLVAIGIAVPAFADAQSAVFLVRHAEKFDESDDPPLSPAGKTRAEALARLVRDANIKAIYVTQYQRTVLTATPLATALGLKPVAIHSDAVQELVDRIRRDHPKDAVLLVGHSGSVPKVLKLLGHETPVEIGHEEYDSLFVAVPRAGGRPTVLRLRF